MAALDKTLKYVINFFNRPILFMSFHLKTTIILLGVLYLALSISMTLRDYPIPYVHDEFAYLLGADTFAHGKLANPTHEHWRHFESFHILHQPTYQSKYPPAASVSMALGIILTGRPITGVWITTALATALVFWMLLAWLPPRWAVMGGFIAALHPGIHLLWGQSYWGGSVPMIGGALVLGSSRRLVKTWSHSIACLLGLGFLVLAHSRPFEGALLSIPLVIFILYRAFLALRSGGLKKLACPFTILILMSVLIVLSVCFYNRAVTGNCFKFPHALWSETYMNPDAPSSNPRLSGYSGSPMGTSLFRVERIVWFYLGFWMALPLILVKIKDAPHLISTIFIIGLIVIMLGLVFPMLNMNPHMLMVILLFCQAVILARNIKDPWILSALGIITALTGLSVAYSHAWPHYTAPAAPLVFYLLIQAVRAVRTQYAGPWIKGRHVVFILPLIMLISMLVVIYRHPSADPPGWDRLGVYAVPDWSRDRALLLKALRSRPGLHLVFVRYPRWYNIHCEWVYNEADIDGSKVVWAHDLGSAPNRELIGYFKDRNAWLLDLAGQPPALKPYIP